METLNLKKTPQKAMKIPKVVIVVLVYNGLKWLDECLKSVMKTAYPNFEVVVVDNHSADKSVEYVQKNFAGVKIIRNHKNFGTAEGSNVGIRYALENGADYVAVLNQDLKVDESWLKELIHVAEQDKDIGLLSPIQYGYDGKTLDKHFKELLEETTYFDDILSHTHREKYYLSRAVGASFLIKKEVFLKVGLFDPLYFMYQSDNDFCRRVMFKGFKIACVPTSAIFHYHHLVQGAQVSESFLSRIVYLNKRNYFVFILKDPNHSFFWNLKHAYIWTNWPKLFKKFKSRHLLMLRTFLFLLFYMPVIYWKYIGERRAPCYLNLKVC